MILSMSAQAAFFLHTALLGGLCGVCYDALRLLRRYIKHSDLVTHAEDFLYWVFVTLFVFYFLLNRYYGEIRGFVFLGFALGMIVYMSGPSRMVLMLACRLIDVVRHILSRVFYVLTYPVRAVAVRLYPHTKKLAESAKKQLHILRKYAKIRAYMFRRNVFIVLKKI